MRRGLRWVFGGAAVLVAAMGVGLSWWEGRLAQEAAVAQAGLLWQAGLGIRPYLPAIGGLVALGSQADLVGRYLTLMDSEAERQAGLVPVNAWVVQDQVVGQALGLSGGYVEYAVTEERVMQQGRRPESAEIRGLVTVYVSPAATRPWDVTGISYNFDPLAVPNPPPSVSYLREQLTAPPGNPLGRF
jgi:hypothetical protein